MCAFTYVTSELLPVGALETIARDLGRSQTLVGLLLSAYAVTVALTAIPVTRLTRGWDRRTVVVVTMLVLGLGNGFAAVAPGFATVVIARVAIAVAHGLFWSSIGSVAARLVPPGRAGAATAAVFSGNALALVAGVPATNAVATAFGWRTGTVVIAFAGLAAAAAALRWLPAMAAPEPRSPTAASARADNGRAVMVISAATLAMVTAYFAVYTYITPILTQIGLQSRQPVVLVALGVAGLLGIIATSRAVDAHPWITPFGQSVLVMLAFATAVSMAGTAQVTVGWLLLTSVGYAGLAVSWQAGILRVAPRSPDRASAAYVVAFQIGITSGPALGGAFRGTFGMDWLFLAAAVLAALSAAAYPVVSMIMVRHAHGSSSRPCDHDAGTPPAVPAPPTGH
ncbi:MFS transporter [Actinoallomurus iriomotensis]|uniref:MFS transporter n=1 Tax=Actinoallomurus iriomotensis TaxID=478107 RepID=A0A9W6VXZ8_9ACTN|nr:MFS transporter [Actinoallomurus iriomotensis]GLY82341.1 MFS transporter [Actinoallomurus iriomotensis]